MLFRSLTAHVIFTALRQWGARSGLEILGLLRQTAFLLALGKGNDFADLYDEEMNETGRTRPPATKNPNLPRRPRRTLASPPPTKGVPRAQLTALDPL